MAPLNSRFSAAAPLNSSLWAGNRYPSQRQYNTTDEEVAAVFGYDRRDRTQARGTRPPNRSLFGDKIPENVDFEILQSCHTKLLKPALASSQCGLNGEMIHRIFKGKPIYVVPSRKIFSNPYIQVPSAPIVSLVST